MRHCKIILLLLFTVTPSFSFGQVVINEIMYDVSGSDSGREWIEVQNTGTVETDISSWKFLESSSASNHSLTLIQGTASIPPSGLAVIVSDGAKFLIDWSGFSGAIFKASFSMNNTGSTLILKDPDLNVKGEVIYSSAQGAAGDGNSLQRNGAVWISGGPTPGAQNVSNSNNSIATTTNNSSSSSSQSSSSNNSNTTSSSSSHSSPVPLSDSAPKIVFEVSAGRERLTSVGNRIVFQASVAKSDGISGNSIFYNWSFGDGSTGQGKGVSHQYQFPGEYTVVLNSVSSDLESVSRVTVKVTSPQISLTKVSGGIEVQNKSSAEINIGGWNLAANQKSFEFPKDTIIQANKKVTFPDSVTNLIGDKVEIINPLAQVVATFETAPVLVVNTVSVSSTTQNEIFVLQTKLEKAVNELAKLTTTLEVSAPLIVVEPEVETVEIITKGSTSTSLNLTSVFVAEKSNGTISKIFSWPIKGVNWVTRFFVEE